jgi:hypothetical protein
LPRKLGDRARRRKLSASARSTSALALLLVALTCGSAAAQTRVVVRPFEGQMSMRVRDAVAGSLEQAGHDVVSNKEADRAADAAGADLSEPAGRFAVAGELGITAYVEGSVSKRGPNFIVQLTVYDGASGEPLGEGELRAKKAALVRTVRKDAAEKLADALSRAKAPEPVPSPAEAPLAEEAEASAPEAAQEDPEADADEAEDTSEPEPDDGERPKAFELGVGLRLTTRSMSYNDAPRSLGESSYRVTPAAVLGLRWYPAAHFSSGAAAHVGLEGGLQLLYPIESERGTEKFETSSLAFDVGLHGRLPVGEHELGLTAGYGQHSVEIADSDAGFDPGVPSVAYGFLRLVLNARFELTDAIGLRLGAGYRVLLSYGELGEDEWFQRSGGGGIEAEIALGYALSEALALEASFGLWRYFLSLEPEPSDPSVINSARIAGGLSDQYLRFGLGIVLQL